MPDRILLEDGAFLLLEDTSFLLNEVSSAAFAQVAFRFYADGPETALITPPAPTSGVVDDTANTFGFTLAVGYVLADHEYSVNNGSSWADVSANPISVGNVAISTGHLQVRVKAATGRNASAVLSNASAFMIAGGDPSGFVTWSGTSNATTSGNDFYQTNGNSNTYGHTVETINPSSESYFEFKGDPTNGLNSIRVGLRLASLMPDSDFSMVNFLLAIDSNGDVYKNSSGAVDNIGAYNSTTDTLRIGFSAAGKLQAWKNGSVVWTDSGAAIAAADYVLYAFVFNDFGPTATGIRDVAYQQ